MWEARGVLRRRPPARRPKNRRGVQFVTPLPVVLAEIFLVLAPLLRGCQLPHTVPTVPTAVGTQQCQSVCSKITQSFSPVVTYFRVVVRERGESGGTK